MPGWKEKAELLEGVVKSCDIGTVAHEMQKCWPWEHIAQALESAYSAGRKSGWVEASHKIESIAAEFGDDPKACLQIIEEWFYGEAASESP